MSEFYWDDDFINRVSAAMGRQNYNNAVDLAGKAADEAPNEFGDLSGSLKPGGEHSLFASEVGGLIMTVGSELPYAAVQHERLDFNHPSLKRMKRESNQEAAKDFNGADPAFAGKAKYIEDPLNADKSEYMRRLAAAAQEAMKG